MAVPTRYIRRVKTGLGFAADNDVFENFIDGMTDVDVAVGIRRTVVQNEFRAAFGNFAQFLVAFFARTSFSAMQARAWQDCRALETGSRAGLRFYCNRSFSNLYCCGISVSDGLIAHFKKNRPSEKIQRTYCSPIVLIL